METTAAVRLIFESLHLAKIDREGWKLAGVTDPENVAEHSHGAAIVGYVLAKMEGADADRVAAIAAFHDLGEARIGDQHKLAVRYLRDKDAAEDAARREQVADLPFGNEILAIVDEYETGSTPEGVIAKDADRLQMAFRAKAYLETGHTAARQWIDVAGRSLKTASAKKLFAEMEKSSFTDWWLKAELKKLD